TQHYADFDHQIAVLNQGKALSDREFEQAVQNVTRVLLKGVGLSA
ncbi:TetR family transcriptional regulator C-terminal domain-containing protein, partial [Cobetia sp.]